MPVTRIAAREGREARLQHAAGVREELHRRNAVMKAVDVLMDGLKAVGENRKPDRRNRRESAMAILAYAEGRPIEMVFQVTEKISSGPTLESLLATEGAADTLIALLLTNPEATRKLQSAIERHRSGLSVVPAA